MEKDQNIENNKKTDEFKETDSEEKKENIEESSSDKNNEENIEESSSDKNNEEIKEVSSEDQIKELEDKVTRTFAEMENQRRRFEKERDDALSYGGFTFAKEIFFE